MWINPKSDDRLTQRQQLRELNSRTTITRFHAIISRVPSLLIGAVSLG